MKHNPIIGCKCFKKFCPTYWSLLSFKNGSNTVSDLFLARIFGTSPSKVLRRNRNIAFNHVCACSGFCGDRIVSSETRPFDKELIHPSQLCSGDIHLFFKGREPR